MRTTCVFLLCLILISLSHAVPQGEEESAGPGGQDLSTLLTDNFGVFVVSIVNMVKKLPGLGPLLGGLLEKLVGLIQQTIQS